MTREEHLAWCKKRAHEYLSVGDVNNAVTSMLSDLNKHEETKLPLGSILNVLGVRVMLSHDHHEAKRFIDGFN